MTNTYKIRKRPSYYVTPSTRRDMSGKRIVKPNMFDIMEVNDGETNFIASISNRGDRLNNILKRGIPLDDAKNLFYAMDSQ